MSIRRRQVVLDTYCELLNIMRVSLLRLPATSPLRRSQQKGRAKPAPASPIARRARSNRTRLVRRAEERPRRKGMRNDARPSGEDAGRQSPVPSHSTSRGPRETSAAGRDRATHDRRSPIVNRAEETVRRKEADTDPAMPTGDSTLKITI